MSRKELIQEMQMCLICEPYFDRKREVLAHEIGMHVKVFKDSYIDIHGKKVEFVNESTWCPPKNKPQ